MQTKEKETAMLLEVTDGHEYIYTKDMISDINPGECMRVYMSACVCTVFLKKKKKKRLG
jgi:hypothetical protein